MTDQGSFSTQHRDFVGYGRDGANLYWPDGARIAVNLCVAYESGSEASYPAGDERNEQFGELPAIEGYRDLIVESVFEYGSRAGFWRLQRLLDEYKLPATMFGCARAFEANPQVGEYVREAGHDVCGHGLRWEFIYPLEREAERERMLEAIASIERTCGERPRGWMSRYASVNTRDLLVEEGGFVYDSDSFADDVPYMTKAAAGGEILIVPYSLVYNDFRFLPGVVHPSLYADLLCRAFDMLWDEGEQRPKMMSIGIHPRYMGQAGRASAIKEFVEHALARGDVWFARRIDIAQWWLDHRAEFEA